MLEERASGADKYSGTHSDIFLSDKCAEECGIRRRMHMDTKEARGQMWCICGAVVTTCCCTEVASEEQRSLPQSNKRDAAHN